MKLIGDLTNIRDCKKYCRNKTNRYLVVEATNSVLAFDVTNTASPVPVGVNVGLTNISTDDNGETFVGIIYLSGESKVMTTYTDGDIRISDDFDIGTQRFNTLLAVENTTATALAKIGGVDYALVTVTNNTYPDYTSLLAYDAANPHNIVKITTMKRHIGDIQQIKTFEITGKHYVVTIGSDGVGMVDVSDLLNPVTGGDAGTVATTSAPWPGL